MEIVSTDLLEVLREETETLLAEMRRDGFWYCGERRHDATTYDINCGRCEDLADAVAERIPGVEAINAYDPELHPFDEDCSECGKPAFVVSPQEHHHGNPSNINHAADADHEAFVGWTSDHCVIEYRGRFYDAECHEGVDRVRDLPIYKNRGKTRSEILRERDTKQVA
jgi:hypothetical protein